jgi:hypothetical protein
VNPTKKLDKSDSELGFVIILHYIRKSVKKCTDEKLIVEKDKLIEEIKIIIIN